METNRLRQFCVIAETQNLRKAAEVLEVSHSGLFKSLKVLEGELGFELFQKEGRGIILTEKGKELLPRAGKFLEAQEVFLRGGTKPRGGLRIGTFEVFSTYFFSGVLAKAVDERSILVRELIPGALEQSLINNEIDVGITYEPIPLQGLKILEVGKFHMGIFGKRELFARMPFESIPFAAPAIPINSAISGVKGLDGWPDDCFPRNISFKVDMMETALQLCSEGLAVGFFPEFIIELFNKTRIEILKLQKLPHESVSIKRKVFLVLRNSSDETSSIKKIARSIRLTCSGK